ncbi:MAG: 23S rRNA (adenine(2503)-C(2))-methyltransferase RlmN [Oscillospiraceae bacterium]|jgi:23S rRNA (adenine2503-C2)-methyltransferase|nr:23S rRNA (adenine(2503)-C(2))-methyltransferase RlmN [Oscillospiraceae bacterium]
MTNNAARVDPVAFGLDGLGGLMADWGEPAYRADQLYRYALKGVPPDRMMTLPPALRSRLNETLADNRVIIVRELSDGQDGCVKYLYQLSDGQRVEGVRMRYHHGDTLCLSTQAGCRMGCRFCASTLDGLARNLTAGEMIGQIAVASARSPARNIVLMGSGEALDNYDNTLLFLRAANDPRGLDIGMRRVSLSTCGMADAIERFAGEGLPVTLCVSLHAPDDSLRRELMPIAQKYPLPRLIASCKAYIRETGRRVIFEYAMIDGVNDSPEHARRLASLVRGMQSHVNLIPLNPIPERDLRPSPDASVAKFQRELEAAGVSVTRRRSLGGGVQGACGQLRQSVMNNNRSGGLRPLD